MAERDAGHEDNADFVTEESDRAASAAPNEPAAPAPSGLVDHKPGTDLGVGRPEPTEGGSGLQALPNRKDPGEIPQGSFAERARRAEEGS